MTKNRIFRRFYCIGLSAALAEYSVPNIRPFFAEYSAEYSVFGRTLKNLHYWGCIFKIVTKHQLSQKFFKKCSKFEFQIW